MPDKVGDHNNSKCHDSWPCYMHFIPVINARWPLSHLVNITWL